MKIIIGFSGNEELEAARMDITTATWDIKQSCTKQHDEFLKRGPECERTWTLEPVHQQCMPP